MSRPSIQITIRASRYQWSAVFLHSVFETSTSYGKHDTEVVLHDTHAQRSRNLQYRSSDFNAATKSKPTNRCPWQFTCHGINIWLAAEHSLLKRLPQMTAKSLTETRLMKRLGPPAAQQSHRGDVIGPILVTKLSSVRRLISDMGSGSVRIR